MSNPPVTFDPIEERTAPGGMSQQALKHELFHGYYAEAYTGSMPLGEYIALLSWPDLIKHVKQARVDEANAIAAEIIEADPIFIGMPHTKDYIFDGHAGAGPSGAERWMTCTASLGASRAFLETLTPSQQIEFAKSTIAARQGTTAHAAAESEALLMLGLIDEVEHDMTILELSMLPDTEAESYTEEMGEFIAEYGDLVKSYADAGHEVLIEARVEAAIPLLTVDADGDTAVHVIPGSADFIAMPTPTEKVLTVGDLKYGNGIDVTVDENPQVRIYGLGALDELVARGYDIFDLERIDYHIIQPRLGGIKSWTESVDDLLAWRDDVLSPALTQALGGQRAGAAFTPSEKACHWCPARGGCAALAESRVEEAADLFDIINEAEVAEGPGAFPETGEMSSERLASLYSQVEGLVKIKEDMKAELQRRLHRGQPVPGYHLVKYQPKRVWNEDADAALDPDSNQWDGPLNPDTLALIHQTKRLSPTQAIAALKNNGITEHETLLEPFIEKPPVRPVVAPVTDRRKPWEGRPPETMFDDETVAE